MVETGKQLKVNFADCEIRSRRYFEEKQSPTLPSRAEILDGFYGFHKEPDKIEKEVSVILYMQHMSNKVLEYRSEQVYIPELTLRLILEEKRTTIIYIDPENPDIILI